MTGMRYYMLLSGGLHVALLLFVFIVFNPALHKKTPAPTYTVDFVGGTTAKPMDAPKHEESSIAAAQQQEAAPQPAPHAQETPQIAKANVAEGISLKKFKTKTKKNSKTQPLESPSVLSAPSVLKDLPKQATPAPTTQKQPGTAINPSPASTGGVSSVSTDFPDFPYPWYITRVRNALYNEWSSKKPRGGDISATILFYIQRDGSIKGVTAEKPSGNKLFDFAASSSVEQAAPFPPLPAEFKKKELAIHVEFKTGD